MKLAGIELRNFRSIGNESVVLNPLRKCNILIGQNNAGKSNVLRAVQNIADQLRVDGNKKSLANLDLHKRSLDNSFQFRLCFDLQDSDREPTQLLDDTSVYFDFSWGASGLNVVDNSFANVTDFNRANKLLETFAGKYWRQRVPQDVIHKEFVELGKNIFTRFAPSIPPVYFVPEFRQIQAGDSYSLSGSNLTRTSRNQTGKAERESRTQAWSIAPSAH